jgi:hypothetical protein
MHFLSHVGSEVDLDRMLRLAYDVQLQLLTTRRKVLLKNQSAMGRKSRLPTCWLAQVNERLLMYNLCIDSDQLPHVLASSSWLKGNTLYTIKWL